MVKFKIFKKDIPNDGTVGIFGIAINRVEVALGAGLKQRKAAGNPAECDGIIAIIYQLKT